MLEIKEVLSESNFSHISIVTI